MLIAKPPSEKLPSGVDCNSQLDNVKRVRDMGILSPKREVFIHPPLLKAQRENRKVVRARDG